MITFFLCSEISCWLQDSLGVCNLSAYDIRLAATHSSNYDILIKYDTSNYDAITLCAGPKVGLHYICIL